MKSSRLPPECMAFKVNCPVLWSWHGKIVEMVGIWGNHFECRMADGSVERTGALYPCELRPLTPSARAALALVQS